MIKAVIFDLDNTLLDFMKMKEYAVKAAIAGMIEAGLDIYDEEFLSRYTNAPYMIMPDGHYARDEGTGEPLVLSP